MKYRQLVSISTPASLQDWLEEELESRGIDGVYTRYILSLLQQDSIDLDPSECEHLSPNGKHVHQISRKETCKNKQHRRGKSWERQLKGDSCNCTKPVLLDTEKRKKTAAVECLKSASEQKSGIEKLIDEVCAKLKYVQTSSAKETIQLITSSPEICLQHSEILEPSSHEQAEKYYEAFPALSGKHEPLAELCQQQEIWTVWDGRKVVGDVSKDEILKAVQNDLDASDPESESSEKENRSAAHVLKDVAKSSSKAQEPKEDSQLDARSATPSFIVPKMKIPIHKVANWSMYSPFTSSAYQVWEGRKVVANARREETLQAGQNDVGASDTESQGSDNEIENAEKETTSKTEEVKEDSHVNAKTAAPSFVVPKMKIPIHKVANLSMYSPLTSSAFQVGKTVGTGCKTEYMAQKNFFGLDKLSIGEEDFRQLHMAALPSKLVMETDTWELLASLRASTPFGKIADDNEYQDDLISNLANKFDSNLASIWAKEDVEDMDDLGLPEELELSLRIYSVKTPTSNHDLANKDVDAASVWAVSLEDCKIMKSQERFGSPFLTSVISIPTLLQSLASQTLSIPGKQLSISADSSPFLECENAFGKEKVCTMPEPEDDLKDGELDDMESILCTCPDVLFSTSSSDEKSPYSSEYGSISPSELLVGGTQRMYNLWEEGEQKGCRNIWVHSDNVEKVVSWISSQTDEEMPHLALEPDNGWKTPIALDFSASKDCSTFFYHKGESRFVEVVPSSKKSSLCGNEMKANKSSSSASNTLEVEEEENLLTSPKTHFQPIRQDSSEGESITDEIEVLFEESGSTPTPGFSYKGSPTPEIQSAPPGFERPVSSSLDELVLLLEKSNKKRLSSDTVEDLIEKGFSLEEFDDPSITLKAENTPTFSDNRVWSSGSLEETLSELNLPWKWSTTDDSSECLWMPSQIGQEDDLDDDIFEETDIGYMADGGNRDYNLKALRKELEEEEEELFRDINCLSDSDDASYKETFCKEVTTYIDKIQEMAISESKLSCFETKNWEKGGQALNNGDSNSEDETDKECQENGEPDSKFPLVPVDKVLYSSELEDEWRKTSEPFDVQVPKKSKNKTKVLSQKRPCTFYLEGNCRRSDCKFSHDLASITCRFWEEGSCFKGITCPFLHGYLNDIHPCDEHSASHKFILESESDFPSLSKSGATVHASTSAKMSLKTAGRIIRPKKKKQSTMEIHKRLENPDPTL